MSSTLPNHRAISLVAICAFSENSISGTHQEIPDIVIRKTLMFVEVFDVVSVYLIWCNCPEMQLL
jgi:hypothetical protein